MRSNLSKMLLALFLFAGISYAQIPKTISYQGVLTDSSGAVVADGHYQLFLSLYEQSDGGQSIWDELQQVNTRNGVFNVILGSATALNLAFDKPYWLELEVDGEVLSPRTELTASAYSFNAADVADSIVTGAKIADGQVVRSVNGLSDDVTISAGANVTITPQGNNLVVGATGGSGNSPWTINNNDIYFQGGDVGIGTTNPSEQLELTGNIKLPSTANGGNGPVGVLYSDTSHVLHTYGDDNFFAGEGAGNFTTTGAGKNTGVGKNALGANQGGRNNTAVGYFAMFSNTSGSDNVAIGRGALGNNTTGSDNVVIGAGTAFGSQTGSGNTVVGDGAGVIPDADNATAIGQGAFANSNTIRLGNSQVTDVNTSGTINAAAFVGDGSGLTNVSSIWDASGSSTYYNNGYVGIGVSSPNANVHSHSTGDIPSFLASGSSGDFAVPAPVQNMQFGQWDGTSFTEWMRLSPEGYLGIGGITTPLARVHSQSNGNEPSFMSSGDLDYAVPDGEEMKFGQWNGTSSNQFMRITDLGNVVIGGAIGFAKLRVNGAAGLNETVASFYESSLDLDKTVLELHVGTSSVPNANVFKTAVVNGFYDLKYRVQVDGNVFADGTFSGGGADFAEMIEVSSGAQSAEAGDVLVIDLSNNRSVVKSTEARSTLVAGIVSSKPGFLGSEREWDRASGEESMNLTMEDFARDYNEMPMAIVGIVPCKVSAENGAIRRGDLLVTSSTPGHAMRDVDPKNGTIVGKALGELSSGTGVIKVLITLQ